MTRLKRRSSIVLVELHYLRQVDHQWQGVMS